jgi:putative hydroxymethylpyrimidine transport system substrate-binding protein
MLGGFSNIEGVDLRERGENPVVTPVDQLGVPTYDELVLVAQGKRLADDPQSIRLFLAALARGTTAAIENPGATAAALSEANPDLDPKLVQPEVAATLPLLSRSGTMNPAEWKHFIGWMRDNGLISSLPSTAEVLDNSYLPGKISE